MFSEIITEICYFPYVQHSFQTMYKVTAISVAHNHSNHANLTLVIVSVKYVPEAAYVLSFLISAILLFI